MKRKVSLLTYYLHFVIVKSIFLIKHFLDTVCELQRTMWLYFVFIVSKNGSILISVKTLKKNIAKHCIFVQINIQCDKTCKSSKSTVCVMYTHKHILFKYKEFLLWWITVGVVLKYYSEVLMPEYFHLMSLYTDTTDTRHFRGMHCLNVFTCNCI